MKEKKVLRLLDRRRKQQSCAHQTTAVTRNYGLERIVCLECGNVDLADLAEEETTEESETAEESDRS